MHTQDSGEAGDTVGVSLDRRRPVTDSGRVVGRGIAVVTDEHGNVKQKVRFVNLITQVGDQMYMERGANLGGPPDFPTGMRLGTGGATAAAKTGAGAAIVTYISASSIGPDAGFPTSALNVNARRITYQTVWAAGIATNGAIDEWVVTNETALTDVAGVAANTVSRAVTGTPLNKTATDTLTITWTHDFEGT